MTLTYRRSQASRSQIYLPHSYFPLIFIVAIISSSVHRGPDYSSADSNFSIALGPAAAQASEYIFCHIILETMNII